MSDNKEAFNQLAHKYSTIQDHNWGDMSKFAHRNVILDSGISRVLDVGNGGAPPQELLLPEQVRKLKLFVGMDLSHSMLRRNEYDSRVVGDGFDPPFKKGSFDTVMVWECLHHLGLTGSPDSLKVLKRFVLRVGEMVAPDGYIYIIEPTFPAWLEWLERVVFRLLFLLKKGEGTTKAYIFSTGMVSKIMAEQFDCEYLERVPMHRILGGRLKPYIPMIFLSWFKIPVGLIPAGVLYCRARPRSRENG